MDAKVWGHCKWSTPDNPFCDPSGTKDLTQPIERKKKRCKKERKNRWKKSVIRRTKWVSARCATVIIASSVKLSSCKNTQHHQRRRRLVLDDHPPSLNTPWRRKTERFSLQDVTGIEYIVVYIKIYKYSSLLTKLDTYSSLHWNK